MKQLIKDSKITGAILELVNSGIPLPAALDLVLGDGTYGRLVDDLYKALREA